MITIFTPTYNRAYILSNLYESLKRQTSMDFEWLVVDDGSTDSTEELFNKWKSEENAFPIYYVKQTNGGKHRAINRGVSLAHGELFFIVDSDDYLSEDAIRIISSYYQQIKDDDSIAGICGMKVYPNGKRVGGDVNFDTINCSLFDFRYKYGIYGDIAEVYKTSVLEQFPFPDVPGEKFCSEALIWYPIASKYTLLFFNRGIYICDYLADGLTQNSFKHRVNSPIYAMKTYLQVVKSPIPMSKRMKAIVSYWRFYFHCPRYKRFIFKPILFVAPIGYLIYLMDKIKEK